MSGRWESLTVDDHPMRCYSALPAGSGPFPGVLICMHAPGVDGFIQGPLSGENLIEKADEVAGDLDPRRAAATAVAVAAGNALASLARQDVDVSAALADLGAQLDRDDAVSIPAANAIGEGGNLASIGALRAALSGDGSDALKIAAAAAVGKILGRADTVPSDLFDELLTIAESADADIALRRAVVTALGKGKLAPGERLKLIEALSVIAAGSDGDGS